jgi:hypothetical protein
MRILRLILALEKKVRRYHRFRYEEAIGLYKVRLSNAGSFQVEAEQCGILQEVVASTKLVIEVIEDNKWGYHVAINRDEVGKCENCAGAISPPLPPREPVAWRLVSVNRAWIYNSTKPALRQPFHVWAVD